MACAGVDPGLVVAGEACLSSEDEGVSGGQGEVGAGVTVVGGVAQPEGAPVTEAEGYGQVADALAVVMVAAQVQPGRGVRLPGVRSFQLASAVLAAAKAAYG